MGSSNGRLGGSFRKLGYLRVPLKGNKTGTIREFPKIRGTLFWGPYHKDPTIQGTILGPPIFGNSHKGFFKGLCAPKSDGLESEYETPLRV